MNEVDQKLSVLSSSLLNIILNELDEAGEMLTVASAVLIHLALTEGIKKRVFLETVESHFDSKKKDFNASKNKKLR